MFEETNQTMEGNELDNLPENLFEDDEFKAEDAADVSEEGTSGSEDNTTESTDDGAADGENHAEDGATDGSTLRVKYNGEERDISLDEARTLAQKGLNYDHVVAERDKNREAFNFLLERAKGEGITVEQLMERERNKAEDQRLADKKSEIRARDDDASEATIETLAKLELEAEKNRNEQERAKALETENKARIEGWNRLFREHPEFISQDGGSKVSKEVYDLVDKQGYSPVEAYYIVRNRELETQNRVMSDASAAKKKSVGSLAGVQSTEEDEFLAGFDLN